MSAHSGQGADGLAAWATDAALTVAEAQFLDLLAIESPGATALLTEVRGGQLFVTGPGPDVASLAARCFERGLRAHECAHWQVAEGGLGLALRLQLQLGGSTSRQVLDCAHRLAPVLRIRGKLQAAREMQTVVLAQRAKSLGAEHDDALAAELQLAETLLLQGHFEEARAHQQHVLEARIDTLGADHSSTAEAEQDLGATLIAQGSLSRAEALLRHAVETRRRLHGADARLTLDAENGLAATLWAQRDLAGALALQEHVVDVSRRHAANERELLTYEGNLAATLHMQGHLLEAKRIQERVVQAQSRIFGRKHPDAIGAQSNLAWTLRKLGELDRARDLAQEAADSSRELLGAGHPTTFAAEGALIQTLSAQGDEDSLRNMAVDGLARLPTMSTSIGNAAARYAFLLSQLEAQCAAAAAIDSVHASKLAWITGLLDSLPATSMAFRDALELCHADERRASLAHYIGFHASWIRLCMLLAPRRLPQAMAPLHGMESWSTLLNRLQDADMATRSTPHAALLKARQDLQQLRLHLTTLAAMIDSALGHIADHEARLHGMTPGLDGNVDDDDAADPSLRVAVSTQMIVGLRQELGEQLARRTELRSQEGAAIDGYRSARAELARVDPGMAALRVMPALTSADLAARLTPHEALLITVALPPGRAIVAVIRPHTMSIIELADLPTAMNLAARYQAGRRAQMRGAGLRDGCFATRDEGQHTPAADVEVIATATLVGAVQRSFWQPLAQSLAGARRIHLVTGPGHHSVPLECGVASNGAAAVHRYFGLPAYLSVHDRPLALPPPDEIDIVADCAWDSTPIPFVEAEARLVHALVSSHGHARRVQGHELLNAGRVARRLLLCVHGGVAGPQGREHGYLVLDASLRPTLKLDPPKVAQLSASIAEVYASACVGAVVGSNDTGSALGVCSEWQLRGVTTVIACLAPVEDHFMPLLAGLYWHRRLKGQVPHAALAGAKADLCCGDWPAALIEPLRDAYRHTMQKVLARAIWRPSAASADDIEGNSAGKIALRTAQTLRGWLLPPYIRSNHFEGPGFDAVAHREFSAQHCENPGNAERLLRQCLGYLIDERARPEDLAVRAFAKAAIDNICAFTHCFGSGGVTGERHGT